METFIATYGSEENAQAAMNELIDAGFDPAFMRFRPDVDQSGAVAYSKLEYADIDLESKAFLDEVREGDSILALQCTPKREKEAFEIFQDHGPNVLEARRTGEGEVDWSASKESEGRESRASRGGAPTSPQYVTGDRPTSKDYVRRDPSRRERRDGS